MNRNAGLSAGVIALIAVVVHMVLPAGPESRTAAEPPAGAAATERTQPVEPSQAGSPTPPVEPEGPWLATRYFYGDTSPAGETPVDLNKTASVLGCANQAADTMAAACGPLLARYFGIPDGVEPDFLLATIPDPLHTRLSLFTDTSIQAIQSAATRAHWRFATQWLPWNDTVDPNEKDPEKRQKQREAVRNREKQPGLLVFRHALDCPPDAGGCTFSPRVLLLWVLGETPTAGVNPTQFQLARAYMRAIHEPKQIGIVGPTFSGSFDSLHRLIENDAKTNETRFEIQSGTATDAAAGRAVRAPGVAFHSANGRGSFHDVLTRLDIPPDNAAELVEDESGYGESAVTADEKVRVFRFPRDISHLRNAWRETAQTSKSSGAPEPDLDFSLKDNETGEDSVPVFSGTQSPLSQNAVLDEITGAIRRDRIRIVQIDATNVLDLLFLTRILKRQCPDTRLVVSSPDLLFVEAARTDALTGMLALSTYPMFDAANEWMGQRHLPAVFPDAFAEGVYNAALLLLNGGRGPSDYHWSDGDARGTIDHPPTWLLTLDREGFLPVDVWRDAQSGWFRELAPRLDELDRKLQLPAPSSLWILVSGITALAILALAVWIRFLAAEKSPVVGSAFDLAPLDPCHPDCHLDHLRLFYLFAFILTLTLIEAILWSPLWHNRATGGLRVQALLPSAGVIVGSILAATCFRGIDGPRYTRAAAAGLISFLAVFLLWLACCYGSERNFFFSFRALELRVGTSPSWPVLAALTILLGFAFAHLWRLHLVVYEAPEAPMEIVPTLLKPRLQRSYGDLNRSLESPLGLFKDVHWTWARYALALAAVVFLVTRLDVRLSSIDGPAYDILSICLTLLAAAALLVSSCQVLIVWRALEGILGGLNTMPLGRSFVRTDQSGRSRPIWVKQLHVQSIDVHARSMLVLHDISLLLTRSAQSSTEMERWEEWIVRYRERVGKLLEADTRAKARAIRQSVRDLSGEIAAAAFAIARQHWTLESLVGKAAPAESPGEGGEAPHAHAPLEIPGDPRKIGDLAETFVALHYSPYLLYCVRQIRNLILFLSVGFPFLVICLNAYSRQSPQFIGRSLFVMFLIIGTVTVTCLVGLERDPILSRIAGTTPGKLDIESYLKVIGYGTLPVLGLLASQFPSISGFLYSWVAPTLQALH